MGREEGCVSDLRLCKMLVRVMRLQSEIASQFLRNLSYDQSIIPYSCQTYCTHRVSNEDLQRRIRGAVKVCLKPFCAQRRVFEYSASIRYNRRVLLHWRRCTVQIDGSQDCSAQSRQEWRSVGLSTLEADCLLVGANE
jgi:hypothetical protein